jgi:hypothetical protein
MLSSLAVALTLFFETAPTAAVPDQIHMKGGRTLSGRIVSETRDELRIRSGRGEVEVARANVTSVRSLEHSLAEFLHRWDSMRHDDPVALAELARFCASRGLTGEARNAWLRILTLDPGSEEAARAIGAQRFEGGWHVQSDKQWIKLADYLAPKAQWRHAVDLRTGHFLVRTDLALERVLDAAVQLERHYQRFYDFLGPELNLYVFDEVPVVNVYARVGDYPAPPLAGESSWFAPSNNELHVRAAEAIDMRLITRDVTEMLLFNAFRRSSGHNGEIMPWAQRGIAEYFAATHGAKPGDPWAPLDMPSYLLFTQRAHDKKPPTLTQLLNTARPEFRSGPDGERRSASAYTFVQYLLNGEGGEHRASFFRYLREAWLGRGGRMLVYETLGMKPADLEAHWNDYVETMARHHPLPPKTRKDGS